MTRAALLAAWIAKSVYVVVLLFQTHVEYQRLQNPPAITSRQT